MIKTKPLKELIAELQALEDANPGILCTLDDNEWGANAPKVEFSQVYKNEHNDLIVLDNVNQQDLEEMMQEYMVNTPEQLWENMGGENNGVYDSLEDFKADVERIKLSHGKELELMKTAVPMVVIKI